MKLTKMEEYVAYMTEKVRATRCIELRTMVRNGG